MSVQAINHLGEPVFEVHPGKGFFKREAHFYHFHDRGITHVNIDVINTLERVMLASHEKLEPISQDIFEQEVRNAVFNIGIYSYIKSV